ncbi:MAG: CCA tRNA nucleotidyltransferase [Lachnospiraceae bacterium]|nr:CCA tRNA nucleotidyltransferase [Lachnospiraceae bacterium]
MKITLPKNVNYIITRLNEAGFEAYAVGGCVRDSILGREPEDWDITTSAEPFQVKELFRRCVDTGIEHGTVTVLIKDQSYEVTTFRIDGKYEDGRHPESVEFTKSLTEDLKRRDFTINAMAYSEKTGLVDLFEGQKDLKDRIIRAVGNPVDRFNEDALRIMRAVRFAAQLDYEIEEETSAAAKKLAKNLKKISAERIREELTKLITSYHPQLLLRAWELGITAVILPEFDVMMDTPQNNPHHRYNVGEHTIHAICNIDRDKYDEFDLVVLRYAMLFHDIGKPACKTTDEKGIDHFGGHPQVSRDIAARIMRRLKFDNKTKNAVLSVVLYHDMRPRLTVPGLRKLINIMGSETARVFVDVQTADIMAQSDYERDAKLKRLETTVEYYERIMERKDPLFIKDLDINGQDLMKAGVAEGPLIGDILKHLLTLVLERPELNEKGRLLTLAAEYTPEVALKTDEMSRGNFPSAIVY